MRKLLSSPWQTLGVPSALTPIGQLHQFPPSPVPGDLGRCSSVMCKIYGVATISRLFKIVLFCKRVILKITYSAKETYDLKELTNRSHTIGENGPICEDNRTYL